MRGRSSSPRPARWRRARCSPRSNSISAALAFGRGYGSAEISGDNGIAGSLELRFDQKLNLQYLTGYQLYGFVDSRLAWNDGYRLSDGSR